MNSMKWTEKKKRKNTTNRKKTDLLSEFWAKAFQLLFGILFLLGLWLIFVKPDSRPALLFLAVSGGGANLLHGLTLYRQPKWRNQGMSMILLGAVIGMLGVWLAMVGLGG